MAIRTAAITVGATTPTRLTVAPTDHGVDAWRYAVAIRNDSGVEVRVGGPGVDLADGFPLLDTEKVSMDLNDTEMIYAISTAGDVVLHVIQTGV